MRLIGLAVILSLSLILAPLAARAQPAGKLVRIGILHSGSLPDANIEALRSGLRQRDYVEGRNLIIEYRAAQGKLERLPELATDLVRARVDVIVTGGTAAIRAARDATATIPIVFAGGADPVGTGLVASLARPGGNVTGVTTINVELTPKRLELLKETIPTLSRVGLLWHPGSATSPRSLQELERAAGALGVKVYTLTVRDLVGLQAALEQAGTERLQALVLVPAIFFLANRDHVGERLARSGLPVVAAWREYADAGCLLSYGPNVLELHRLAAGYVDRILKGTKPADLPVEQPTTFELVINLKTAKALGLTIPQSILVRADQVIQ